MLRTLPRFLLLLGKFLVEAPLAMKLWSNYPLYLTLKAFVDFWQEGKARTRHCLLPEKSFLFGGIDGSLSTYF